MLVPRPETEELVDLVLEWWGDRGAARFVDVGCGTGCLGLALLEALPASSSCVAIDVSPVALALARDNGRGTSGYVVVDRSADHPKPNEEPPFDFVVSNPPYIPTADLENLQPEITRYEDRRALDGGPDGLDLVRCILDCAPSYLDANSTRTVWLELDVSHPRMLADPTARGTILPAPESGGYFARTSVETFDDLSGNPRFAKVSFLPASLMQK